MGQIAPVVGADGANNGYTALAAKFVALQNAAARLLEESERLAQRMRANRDAATVVADLSAAARVDDRHVTAVTDIAAAFGRVVGGCTQLMDAADAMHTAAGQLKTEHQAEYGGIHAAVTASRARQAAPGFYRQT